MDSDASSAPQSTLSSLFDRYFTVLTATTPELLDAAYALRYQVYCVEHAFLDPAQQVNEREIDRCDAHSAHAVLLHVPTGDVVGCVRLVLPDPQGISPLPIREVLDEEGQVLLDKCDPATTAEISRYAVSKMFRRREGETEYPDVVVGDLPVNETRRLMPHVSLGLMRGISRLAADHGVKTVCAAMAPSLLRLIMRMGLTFEPLGQVVDYHGERQPCIADGEALLAGLASRNKDYHRLIDAEYRRSTPTKVE